MLTRGLAVLLFLLLVSSSVFALPIETCRNKNKNYQTSLDVGLDKLEKIYIHYRWTEAKIRRIYYEKIWEARLDGNDPLSPEKRERARI